MFLQHVCFALSLAYYFLAVEKGGYGKAEGDVQWDHDSDNSDVPLPFDLSNQSSLFFENSSSSVANKTLIKTFHDDAVEDRNNQSSATHVAFNDNSQDGSKENNISFPRHLEGPSEDFPWLDLKEASSVDNLYSLTIHSTKIAFDNEAYSCRGQCGRSYYSNFFCSCQAYCYFYKTCCFDFFDECGNSSSVVNLKLSDYSWIEEVSIDCQHNILTVSSCRNQIRSNDINHQPGYYASENRTKGREQLLNFFANEAIKGFLNETVSKNESHSDNDNNDNIMSNSKSETITLTSVTGYIRLLSFMTEDIKEEEDNKMSPFQAMLLSWPLFDTVTNNSYRNLSIYNCNHAKNNAMIPISVIWRLPKVSYIYDNAPKSLDTMLSYRNPEYALFIGGDFLLEKCVEGSISTCTKKKWSDVMRKACDRTNLPVEVSNTGSNSTRVYKNTICAICNGDGQHVKKIRLSGTQPGSGGLELKLSFTDDVIRLTIVGRPIAWKTSICKFEIVGDLFLYLQDLKRGDNSLDDAETVTQGLKDNSQYLRTIKHVCEIETCYLAEQKPPCYLSTKVFLLLPQSKTDMSGEQMKEWMSVFRKILGATIPSQVHIPTILPDAFDEVFNGTRLHNGLLFDYGVKLQYHLGDFVPSVNWTQIAMALVDSHYPFMTGKTYFCGNFESIYYKNLYEPEYCFLFEQSQIASRLDGKTDPLNIVSIRGLVNLEELSTQSNASKLTSIPGTLVLSLFSLCSFKL